jgi:U3 small nucleolar RNA-associated protein 11
MSSLRNSVARRPHRERAQPVERRRLGLLEKHKVTATLNDYGIAY